MHSPRTRPALKTPSTRSNWPAGSAAAAAPPRSPRRRNLRGEECRRARIALLFALRAPPCGGGGAGAGGGGAGAAALPQAGSGAHAVSEVAVMALAPPQPQLAITVGRLPFLRLVQPPLHQA